MGLTQGEVGIHLGVLAKILTEAIEMNEYQSNWASQTERSRNEIYQNRKTRINYLNERIAIIDRLLEEMQVILYGLELNMPSNLNIVNPYNIQRYILDPSELTPLLEVYNKGAEDISEQDFVDLAGKYQKLKNTLNIRLQQEESELYLPIKYVSYIDKEKQGCKKCTGQTTACGIGRWNHDSLPEDIQSARVSPRKNTPHVFAEASSVSDND